MSLDQDFVQVSKLNKDQKKVFTRNGTLFSPISGEDQKKRSSPEMGHFFSPISGEDQKKKVFTRNRTLLLSTDLRSDAHQSQIIGGNADIDHTQIVGGDISPHPPLPWFRHHCLTQISW